MTSETPAELKARLRIAALAERRAIPASIRDGFSLHLRDHGVRLARLLRPDVVSAFYPIGDEPDTLALLDALAAAGIGTALPVTGPRGTSLTFRRWRPGDATVPGPMNIPEPTPDAALVEPSLLFVPLIVFDRRGNRIGYGGGYFDRTLGALRTRKRVRSVGVGYAAGEIADAPREGHDEPMDFIVTEQRFIDVAAPFDFAASF